MKVVWSEFTAPHQQYYSTQELGVDIQRFWRPTQFEYNTGRLTQAMADMDRGEFIKLIDLDPDQGASYVWRHSTSYAKYMTVDWNPFTFWDGGTHQLLTAGARVKTKFVAFSDITGRWREVTQPRTDYIGTAHWYGSTAYDGKKAMLSRWLYEPDTSSWVDFRAETGFTFANQGSLAWWPEYGSEGAWFNANNGSFTLWDVGSRRQVDLGISGHGMHATAIRHPRTGNIYVFAGTNTANRASVVRPNGTFERLKDNPATFAMSTQSLLYHPHQNVILVEAGANADAQLLSYWIDHDDWQWEGAYPGAPEKGYDRHDTFTYNEEHDVWLSHRIDGVFGWKLPEYEFSDNEMTLTINVPWDRICRPDRGQ